MKFTLTLTKWFNPTYLFAATALFAPTTIGAATTIEAAHGMQQAAPPWGFVRNAGQWDNRALFYASSPGVDTWLTRDGVVYDFSTQTGGVWKKVFSRQAPFEKCVFEPAIRKGHVVKMSFQGARQDAAPKGVAPDRGELNFIEKGVRSFSTNSFGEAKLYGLYPGVDLRLYRDNGRPRFDLIVQPRAAPSNIRFRYEGAEGVDQPASDELQLSTSLGKVSFQGLKAYQSSSSSQTPAGVRTPVPCGFKSYPDGTFGFEVGAYDKTKPLTIDPIVFSTIYGAPNGVDRAYCVAIDGFENPYIAGVTTSPTFPTSQGAYNRVIKNSSAFVAKLTADAGHYIYSTVLNSTGISIAVGIAIDSTGRAWVAGSTNGQFPTTANAVQPSFGGGGSDGFVARLNPTGTNLEYGSYFGGSGDDFAAGIALDANNNAYIAGSTDSPDLRTTAGAFQAHFSGVSDGFVAKINSNGSFGYGTYFGDSGQIGISGIAVEPQGAVHVAGTNSGLDFPTTPGAADSSPARLDAFITKFDPNGHSLMFSTLLGGSGDDIGEGLAIDAQGSSYVFGASASTDFPTTQGAFDQNSSSGGLFVTKVSPDGSSFPYSTLTNSSGFLNAIAVDDLGFAYICGTTGPANLVATTANADQSTNKGSTRTGGQGNAYIQVFNDSGTQLIYGSYWGGSEYELGLGIAVDKARNAFLCGSTTSYATVPTPFPTTPGVFMTRMADDTAPPAFANEDCFLTKFQVRNLPVLSGFSLSPGTVAGSQAATGTITLSPPFSAQGNGEDVHLSTDHPSITAFADMKGNPLPSNTLHIPPNSNATNTITAQFQLLTSDVVQTTLVTVRAEMEGDVRFATTTVSPWLGSLTVSPFSVVGGNFATGRVVLNAPAPSKGLTVSVSSNDPSVAYAADVATGQAIGSFIIPGGESTGVFTIKTLGVDIPTSVTFAARITVPSLSATLSEALQILPATVSAVTFTPGAVDGGQSSLGTVSLNGEAGPTPIKINLALTGGTAPVTLSAATLTVPAFKQSSSFMAATQPVSVNTFRNVTAIQANNGQSASASLFVDQIAIQAVNLTSNSVLGGSILTGQVAVSVPAAPGGLTVSIASSNPSYASLSVSQVTIPAGALTSPNFTIKTSVTKAQQVVTITASKLGYTSRTASLTLRPLVVSLKVSPAEVLGGIQSVQGVLATNEAPTNALSFTLTSSNPAGLALPATITVSAGKSSASFQGTTKTVSSTQTVTVSATIKALPANITISQTVTVQPLQLFVAVSPTSVTGGLQNATGTVKLSTAATTSVSIQLRSSAPALASVPASATIVAGASSVTFPIVTYATVADQAVTITASLRGGSFNTAMLTVLSPRVAAISTASPSVVGGTSTSATVTLNAASPGLSVLVQSSNASIVSMPPTVTIANGSRSGTFTVTTNSVSADTTVVLSATYPTGHTVTTALTVLAPRLGSLVLNPNPVIGGNNVTGIVSISVPAPASGITVSLSDDPSQTGSQFVQVPPSVVIPAGKTSATFVIRTQPVSRTVGTTITATFSGNGQQVSSALYLNPG